MILRFIQKKHIILAWKNLYGEQVKSDDFLKILDNVSDPEYDKYLELKKKFES